MYYSFFCFLARLIRRFLIHNFHFPKSHIVSLLYWYYFLRMKQSVKIWVATSIMSFFVASIGLTLPASHLHICLCLAVRDGLFAPLSVILLFCFRISTTSLPSPFCATFTCAHGNKWVKHALIKIWNISLEIKEVSRVSLIKVSLSWNKF